MAISPRRTLLDNSRATRSVSTNTDEQLLDSNIPTLTPLPSSSQQCKSCSKTVPASRLEQEIQRIQTPRINQHTLYRPTPQLTKKRKSEVKNLKVIKRPKTPANTATPTTPPKANAFSTKIITADQIS